MPFTKALEYLGPDFFRARMQQVKDKNQTRGFLYWLIRGRDNDSMPSRTKSGSMQAFKTMYEEYPLIDGFTLDDTGSIPWGQNIPCPVGYFTLICVMPDTGYGQIRYTYAKFTCEITFEEDMRMGMWVFQKDWLPREAL